jgi:hypothetical protein
MNRHTLARFLRLAVMSSGVLLSCLTALQTPALALAIYDDLVQASLSPGSIPSGTSIFFSPGSTSSSQFSSGNALATGAASVSPPGSATALVTGFASGPGSSFAESNYSATIQASLVNFNASTVTFPLTISHSRNSSTSTIPLGGQSNLFSDAVFALIFDGNSVLANFSICSAPPDCNHFDSGSDTFLLAVTPGSHSLQLSVDAFGQADFSDPASPVSPTPEPASLMLLGSTMAGLGFAWRRRRQG